MRLLLISDTHGILSHINDAVERTGADAVVHAGDFGFYDRDSAERLSMRELALRVLHSGLLSDEIARARKMTPEELVRFVKERVLMSELPEYVDGTRLLPVPVHAVWGNHEDKFVLEQFIDGQSAVPNLHLLDERQTYRVGRFNLFGLGGNVLTGRKLFQRPLAGGSGRIWTTLMQVGQLVEIVEEADRSNEADEVRVLVTHVSPGKEPLVGRLAVHTRADFIVSGHMGTPYPAVWSEFTFRGQDEAIHRLDSIQAEVESAWAEEGSNFRDDRERRLVEKGLQVVRSLPGGRVRRGRAGMEPVWFRNTFSINLPEAAQGHAVLVDDGGRVGLETVSRGRESGR